MLAVKAISKSYGRNRVLTDVSLAVPGGSVHAVMGANGAGKSTLMKCIAGAIVPDAGEITVGGVTRTALNPQQSQHLGVAVVYQHLSLIPTLTVAENIFLGAERARFGVTNAVAQKRETLELLRKLGVKAPASARVEDLPADARQMVEIAKAVSKSPKVLILDEPTAALTKAETDRLFAMIGELKKSGIAIVYISHRIPEIFEIADEVTVLRDGRTVLQGKVSETNLQEIITAMVGTKDVQAFSRNAVDPAAGVALRVHELDLGLRRPVSLEVREGEIVGLYGLTDSGREALVAAIAGARSSRGAVEVAGKKAHVAKPGSAIANGIFYVPGDRQHRGLFPDMFSIDNVVLPNLTRFRRFVRTRRKERAYFSRVTEQLNIVPPRARILISELSGGNQQKALLGRWLGQPEKVRLLVLEEPTEGVDAGARRDLYANLRQALGTHRFGVLWSSSDIDELVEMADRVLVMSDGAIVGELSEDISAGRILSLAQQEQAEPLP